MCWPPRDLAVRRRLRTRQLGGVDIGKDDATSIGAADSDHNAVLVEPAILAGAALEIVVLAPDCLLPVLPAVGADMEGRNGEVRVKNLEGEAAVACKSD